MKKHIYVLLFLILSICLFGQDDVSLDYMSAILPGQFLNSAIEDSFFFVNRSNMIEIYKIDEDSLIYLSRAGASNVITGYEICNSILSIKTAYNSRLMTFDISNIRSPELLNSSEMKIRAMNFVCNDYETIYYWSEHYNVYSFLKLNTEYTFDTLYLSTLLNSISYNNNNILAGRFDPNQLLLLDLSDFNSPDSIAILESTSDYLMNDSLLITFIDNTLSIYEFTDSDSISLTRTVHSPYGIKKLWNNYAFTYGNNNLYKYELTPTDFTLIDSLSITNQYRFFDSTLVLDNQIYDLRTMEMVCDFSAPIFNQIVTHSSDEFYDYCITPEYVALTYASSAYDLSDSTDDIGFIVYDNRDYSSPDLIKLENKPEEFYTIHYADSKLLTINTEQSVFKIIDISDLNDITSYSFDNEFHYRSIDFRNDFAFLSFGDSGFVVLGLNSLDSIVTIYENYDFICDHFTFSDEYALVIGAEDGVMILDMETMDIVNTLTFDTEVFGAIIYDNFLYLGMGDKGMKMFDITDVDSPIEHLITVGHKTDKLILIDNNMFTTGVSLYNYDLTVPHIPVIMNFYDGYSIHDQYLYRSDYWHSDVTYESYNTYYIYSLLSPDSPHFVMSLRYEDSYFRAKAKDNLFTCNTDEYDNYFCKIYYISPETHNATDIARIYSIVSSNYISDNYLFTYYYSGIDMYNISSFNEESTFSR